MTKVDIILIGGGGHCTSVIDVIEKENKYKIAGIVDHANKIGSKNLNYPVIATDDDLPRLVREYQYFHITLGFLKTPNRRIELYNEIISKGAQLPVIISPIAHVSNHTIIGVGTVIMHMAQINAGAQVGVNCIINSKALIEHDAFVGDHSHISTGAIINGTASVAEGSFIGSNATIIQGSRVPKYSFVKARQLYFSR
jgi:sugar O-acyltransferase (sialic acid O-acetyltransferase NeuD family)